MWSLSVQVAWVWATRSTIGQKRNLLSCEVDDQLNISHKIPMASSSIKQSRRSSHMLSIVGYYKSCILPAQSNRSVANLGFSQRSTLIDPVLASVFDLSWTKARWSRLSRWPFLLIISQPVFLLLPAQRIENTNIAFTGRTNQCWECWTSAGVCAGGV